MAAGCREYLAWGQSRGICRDHASAGRVCAGGSRGVGCRCQGLRCWTSAGCQGVDRHGHSRHDSGTDARTGWTSPLLPKGGLSFSFCTGPRSSVSVHGHSLQLPPLPWLHCWNDPWVVDHLAGRRWLSSPPWRPATVPTLPP